MFLSRLKGQKFGICINTGLFFNSMTTERRRSINQHLQAEIEHANKEIHLYDQNVLSFCSLLFFFFFFSLRSNCHPLFGFFSTPNLLITQRRKLGRISFLIQDTSAEQPLPCIFSLGFILPRKTPGIVHDALISWFVDF